MGLFQDFLNTVGGPVKKSSWDVQGGGLLQQPAVKKVASEVTQRVVSNRPFVEEKIAKPITNTINKGIDKIPGGFITKKIVAPAAKMGVNSLVDTVSGASALRGAETLLSKPKQEQVKKGGLLDKVSAGGDVLGLLPLGMGRIGTVAKDAKAVVPGSIDALSQAYKFGKTLNDFKKEAKTLKYIKELKDTADLKKLFPENVDVAKPKPSYKINDVMGKLKEQGKKALTAVQDERGFINFGAKVGEEAPSQKLPGISTKVSSANLTPESAAGQLDNIKPVAVNEGAMAPTSQLQVKLPLSQPTTGVKTKAPSIGTKIAGTTETKLLGQGDPWARVDEIVRKNKGMISKQADIYKTEKAARIEQANRAYESAGGGIKGLSAKMAAMSGEYTKAKNTFGQLSKQISENDVKGILDSVQDSSVLDGFEKLNLQEGLGNLIYKNIPLQAAQIEKLSRVIGPNFAKAFSELNVGVKPGFSLLELSTFPRAMKSAWDLSAPLRQGIYFAASHPKDFTRSFKKMFGYAFDPKKLENFTERLSKDPYFAKTQEARIEFTDFGNLSTREEAFMSNIAERIPGIGKIVRASNRAYTGLLNDLRLGVFKSIYKPLEADIAAKRILLREPAIKQDLKLFKQISEDLVKLENPKQITDIGGLVNAGTGRGNFKDAFSLPGRIGVGKYGVNLAPIGEHLGTIANQSAPLLNATWFSPRLIASRMTLLNPFYYKKLSSVARKEALKSSVAMVVAGLTVLGLSKLSGADVGTDPRSADFGKIKLGDGTRYDVWGGFQQYAVLISRMITNQTVSSTTGNTTTYGEKYISGSRADAGIRFFRGKLAPIPSATWDLMEGKNIVGEPVTKTSAVKNAIEPFILSDLEDTVKTYGAFGPIISLPGLFGVGSQTYNSTTSQPKKKKRPIGTRLTR